MTSPVTVAGTVIGLIAGFLLLLAPFVVVFYRRRRAHARRHGAASLVWSSRRDVAVGYGKKVIESFALLNTAERDLEDAPTRRDMMAVESSPLIDLSSAYKPYPVINTSHHKAAGQLHSSNGHNYLDAAYGVEFMGPTAHVHSEIEMDNTLIDISVDHTFKKLLQKRVEYSEEVLNGPVNPGSAGAKGSPYTPEEYEEAMRRARMSAHLVSTFPSITTKKTVNKRSEFMAETLNGPVDGESVHVRGERHTQEEFEQALLELQK
jgi:hypothetical protein